MTLEEACRLLDPNTTAEELAKIEYYNGFNGKKACIEAINEACTLLVGAVRSAHHEARSGTAPDSTKVYLVPEYEIKEIFNDIGRSGWKTKTSPRERFLCLSHTLDNCPALVAVDNTTGDAWTEDFTSLPVALEWLNREDKK